jgi:hypothetical protein
MNRPFSVHDIVKLTERRRQFPGGAAVVEERIVRVTGSERGTDHEGRAGVWIDCVPAPETPLAQSFGHAHLFWADEVLPFGVQTAERLRNQPPGDFRPWPQRRGDVG